MNDQEKEAAMKRILEKKHRTDIAGLLRAQREGKLDEVRIESE